MTERIQVLQTEYGSVNVHVIGCDYCGLERLNTTRGWLQIELPDFVGTRVVFCSYEHAGLYMQDIHQDRLAKGYPVIVGEGENSESSDAFARLNRVLADTVGSAEDDK